MGAFTDFGGPPITGRDEEEKVDVKEPDTEVKDTEEKEPDKEPDKEPEKEPEKKTADKEPEAKEEPKTEPEKIKAKELEGFKTDAAGVMADGEHKVGNTIFPVFKVTKAEFYQNMQYGRKRLRFKTGSNTQQYMNKTRYQRPFYIQYTDSKNKTYSRRIK